MRREYKGFYIEEAGQDGYSLYHVVTGNLAGTFPTIRDSKDEIDAIHSDRNAYARYAGIQPRYLVRKRGRFIYASGGDL